MKNNKGFTLTEMICVLIILALLAVITIPIASSLITIAKEKSYNAQVDQILIGANNWLVKNSTKLSKTGNNCISLATLKEDKYLDNVDIIDPRDNTIMNGYVKFTYDSSYKQFEKEYVKTCE